MTLLFHYRAALEPVVDVVAIAAGVPHPAISNYSRSRDYHIFYDHTLYTLESKIIQRLPFLVRRSAFPANSVDLDCPSG